MIGVAKVTRAIDTQVRAYVDWEVHVVHNARKVLDVKAPRASFNELLTEFTAGARAEWPLFRQASSPFTCHRSWCSSALCALTMSRSITQRRSLRGVHSSRAGRQNLPEARTRRARWRAASAATR